MREVDRRSKHSRRVFLKGAATAVPVLLSQPASPSASKMPGPMRQARCRPRR